MPTTVQRLIRWQGSVGSNSDLRCLIRMWEKLGRRPWSFYIWTICLVKPIDKNKVFCQLPRGANWRDSYSFARRFLFKRHGLLSRTHQLTLPWFAFSSFRKCVSYALIMYYQINRHVIYVLDGSSSSSGMLFQFNWNPVPTYLEQGSILAVTKRDVKKPTTKAYRAGPKKSPLLN